MLPIDPRLGHFGGGYRQQLVRDTLDDGPVGPHVAHVVLGWRDGTARGGRLLEVYVKPTLEVVLVETPAHLKKKTSEEFGLVLIDVGQEA